MATALSHPDALTDDALTGAFRVFQRRRGHRYSLDDVATAWEASRARPGARRHLDLGCGIGSVLLMVAYKLPEARCAAIEAQEVSFALAERNVDRNGVGARVTLRRGDLRDASLVSSLGGGFDLITGTPPYMPPGTSTPSPDTQRTYARIEMRGGVEDYLAAAAPALAPGGAVVVCCDARTPARALDGGEAAGLRAVRRRDVVPREGIKGPLFTVWTFEHATEGDADLEVVPPFVARTAEGMRTPDYLAMRAFFDLPGSAS